MPRETGSRKAQSAGRALGFHEALAAQFNTQSGAILVNGMRATREMIDPDRMWRALRYVIAQQPLLNCRLVRTQGQYRFALQRINNDDRALLLAHATGPRAYDCDAGCDSFDAPRHFDNDIPYRFRLGVDSDKGLSGLSCTIHHAIMDGRSLASMFDAIMMAYRSGGDGDAHPLPPPLPAPSEKQLDHQRGANYWRFLADNLTTGLRSRCVAHVKGDGTGTQSRFAWIEAEDVARLRQDARVMGVTLSDRMAAAAVEAQSSLPDLMPARRWMGQRTALTMAFDLRPLFRNTSVRQPTTLFYAVVPRTLCLKVDPKGETTTLARRIGQWTKDPRWQQPEHWNFTGHLPWLTRFVVWWRLRFSRHFDVGMMFTHLDRLPLQQPNPGHDFFIANARVHDGGFSNHVVSFGTEDGIVMSFAHPAGLLPDDVAQELAGRFFDRLGLARPRLIEGFNGLLAEWQLRNRSDRLASNQADG
jgi:hypothetical protein